MNNAQKNITEFTLQELKDAGFEAYQNREIALSQIENANAAINIINKELQRRSSELAKKSEDLDVEQIPAENVG